MNGSTATHKKAQKSCGRIALIVLDEDLSMSNFVRELQTLINQHSLEQHSNTTDYILAQYMSDCLVAFNRATVRREHWYGRATAAEAISGEKNLEDLSNE